MRSGRAAVLLLAGSAIGCERGCLSVWARDHGLGGGSPVGTPRASDAGVPLSGTDCSDGLSRCLHGKVETSRAAFVPWPCTASEKGGACTCPWDVVGECSGGCVVDGLEIELGADGGGDLAKTQLCRSADVVARPPIPADPSPPLCAERSIRCVDGRIVMCDGANTPGRLGAVCLFGCEPRVGLASDDDGPGGSPTISDGAGGILCRRTHAERR